MIEVILRYDETDRPTGFSCKGHAGYAAAGEDIICAAVTAMATTLIASLTDLLRIRDLTYHLQEGNISCRLGPKAIAEAGEVSLVNILFEAFELGCRQIAHSYDNQYVQVKRA